MRPMDLQSYRDLLGCARVLTANGAPPCAIAELFNRVGTTKNGKAWEEDDIEDLIYQGTPDSIQ